MKIVAIIDCSAGNASVGEMWQETAIFDGEETLETVLRHFGYPCGPTEKRITLTIPHDREEPGE